MNPILVNNFHPNSGIGKYSFNLLRKVQESLPQMQMIYLESKDNLLENISGISKIKQEFSLPFFNKTFSWYYYFPQRIPQGFDLYHLSSHYLSRAALYVKPCIVAHMDLAPVIYPKDYPFLMRFFVKKLFSLYNKMERIMVISPKAGQDLVDRKLADEARIVTIPLGFDEKMFFSLDKKTSRASLGLPQDKKIILHVGSEEKRKNVETVFNAFLEIKKHEPDALLIRIGQKNPALSKFRQDISVQYFQNVPEKNLKFFYNAADVFVFPAIYEGGFAFPPLESMACGTPTIVGKELDLFEKGAILLENSLDYDELASKVVGLFNDNTAKKVSKKALECSKDFTLGKMAEKTLNVYSELLG